MKRQTRVLVVDDHSVLAEGLRYLIEAQEDLSVVGSAADGREALRKVEELQPEVVVMDISMPELNGIEATELIRKRSPHTQVVILSMYSNQERVWRALRAGAHGYIQKKSAGKDIIDAIRTVHNGGRYASQEIAAAITDNYLCGYVAKSPLDALSVRERQVLQLLVEGKANAGIAQTLCLSLKTVETYRSRIMQKLHVGNIPELVKFAIRHGVISIE
jgi:two-component system, NarL family, response regulator NreC